MICCWRILLEELLTIMAGVTVGSHGVCVQLKLGGGRGCRDASGAQNPSITKKDWEGWQMNTTVRKVSSSSSSS